MSHIVITSAGHASDDHQPMIQQALDAVDQAGGGTVSIPDGTHYIGPGDNIEAPVEDPGKYSLKIGSNTHLQLGRSATLIRRFKRNGEQSATIRNKSTGGNSNIRVSGGTIRTANSANIGKHLGFMKVTTLRIDGVQFGDVFADWTSAFMNCNDVLVSDIFINSTDQPNSDGLHFVGCQHVAVTNSIIICGDDCVSFTQENFGELFDLTDCVVSNCYLRSHSANAIRVLVWNNSTKKIARLRFSNIVGKCGDGSSGSGVSIEALTGTNNLFDVEIDGLWLDLTDNTGQALKINNAHRVRLRNAVFMNSNAGALIQACDGVDLIECTIDTLRGSNQTCVLAWDSTNVRIIGGTYRNPTQYGIQLGTDDPVETFQICNAQFINSGSGTRGILVWNATKGLVANNVIRGFTTHGIQETVTSSVNQYIGNQLLSCGTEPLNLDGTDTQAIRNVTDVTTNIQDSGGFRQTIDGWYKDGGLTDLSNSEIPRNNFAVGAGTAGAARFAPRAPGSVTGVVITSDVNATKGYLDAEVFINRTGFAGGAGTATGFKARLDDTVNRARHAATQPQDADKFIAGDEIYIALTTSKSPNPDDWAPVTAKIRCAIEIED